MARVKADSLPVYARAESPFWKAAGLQKTDKTVKFNASVGTGAAAQSFELTCTYPEVSFGGNMQVAVAALGSVENVLNEVQDAINDYLMIQAKNKAKNDSLGFEKRVADSTAAAIAAFVEKRGSQPNDEQIGKIRAKVRARLEELARLEKETADLSDI